jgi:Uma2 family endonuclease
LRSRKEPDEKGNTLVGFQPSAVPLQSWCIKEAKVFPDLVLEIALSSGGLDKLEIYRRFAVPEVWFWRRNALEIFTLRPDGSAFDAAPSSSLLPRLDVPLLESCVKMASWTEARRAFRTSLPAAE